MADDALPIPDIDHVTTGDLEHRVRSLTAEQLQRQLEHEREHAGRATVLSTLEGRLAQLEAGAEPTDGSSAPPDRGGAATPPATGGVSPATQGPPVNPPAHGDPTNPSQPRS